MARGAAGTSTIWFRTIDEQGADMKRLATVWAAGLLLFFLAANAWADEVFLKNGNHLLGTIVSMGEGKLVLKTDFAGRLTIDWAALRGFPRMRRSPWFWRTGR